MARYIDADALIAEIEKLKEDAHNGVSYHQSRQNIGSENELSTWEHIESAFAKVLKIINTFEVKEVDLEKEFNNYLDNVEGMPRMWHSDEQIEWEKDIAKHFFKLGMTVNNKA